MPNWCLNVTKFNHSTDQLLIDKLYNALEKGTLFGEFHPLPLPLKDTVSPTISKTADDHLVNASLNAKYGADNWYNWHADNWGTKWDAKYAEILNRAQHELETEFQTAWSPPIAFYRHLEKTTGVNITAYYWEPGCDYLGRYANGTDQEFQASAYLRHLDATGEDPIDITSVMNFDSYFLDKDEWEKEELLEQDMWLESELAFGEDNEEES